jgi:hypothetical protein
MEYFGDDGERMHMMFNFQVNQHLFYALASPTRRPLVKAMKATKPRPATAQWGMFLRNHDELDLGRLTKSSADGLRRVRAGQEHAALRSGHPRRLRPCSAATAGASSCLQPHVHLPARLSFAMATSSAWAIDCPEGAQLRAHADAMVGRAARRVHQA